MELPAEIGLLENLEYLNLGGNKITDLSPEIEALQNLRALYLDKNQLTTLPPQLKRLKNLKYLDLRDNPLPIPPEILEKVSEPQIILNYYFSLFDDKKISFTKPLNEIKILIIGQRICW